MNESNKKPSVEKSKMRIATKIILSSDILFTCDKCRTIINPPEGKSEVKCKTEYNDVMFLNIQSIRNGTKNYMEFDPFQDIPRTIFGNDNEYQLLLFFFINKKPLHCIFLQMRG